MSRPSEVPCPVEREAMIAGVERAEGAAGHLALVGAGPGDPELLTLKAVRFLREADVILHDDLVNPEVLAFARREARKIHVGKRGGEASCAQGDICRLAVLLAQEGNRVVRLKGGDPLIFGRADEEIAAAREAGVPITIVNGVSAALGAGADLGASLTRRGVARRVQFVTASDADASLPASLDWRAIADPTRPPASIWAGRASPRSCGRRWRPGSIRPRRRASSSTPRGRRRMWWRAWRPDRRKGAGLPGRRAGRAAHRPCAGRGGRDRPPADRGRMNARSGARRQRSRRFEGG